MFIIYVVILIIVSRLLGIYKISIVVKYMYVSFVKSITIEDCE